MKHKLFKRAPKEPRAMAEYVNRELTAEEAYQVDKAEFERQRKILDRVAKRIKSQSWIYGPDHDLSVER